MSEMMHPYEGDREATPDEQREIIGADRLNGFLLDDYVEHDDYIQITAFEEENPSNILTFSAGRGTGDLDNQKPLESYELTEHDKDFVEKGVSRLAGYLAASTSLPDVIFFPDTTARPLYWAVAEPLKKIYAEKGITLPKIIFLKAYAHAIEKGKTEEFDPEQARVETELWENKVKRLKDTGVLGDTSNVLVIDDYVSKEYRAYRALGGTLKAEVPPGNFTWFGFLAKPDTEEEEDMIIASREDRPRPFPERVRSSFDYAATDIQRANTTGVDKFSAAVPARHNPNQGESYSRVLHHGTEVNRDIVVGIRKELKKIGEQVAGTL